MANYYMQYRINIRGSNESRLERAYEVKVGFYV